MDSKIDLRVLELLTSHLVHDLIGPMGAVCNGLELLEDDEFGMAEDAVQLVAKSAGQATAVLKFYRMAYGMAGSRQGTDLNPIRELAVDLLAQSKCELDWPSGPAPEGLPEGASKLLLNLVALATECLPRGGTLGVGLSDGTTLEVKAVGADAALRPDTVEGLAADTKVEDLTPRNIHAYFTRLLAQRLGGDLVASQEGAGFVKLVATLRG